MISIIKSWNAPENPDLTEKIDGEKWRTWRETVQGRRGAEKRTAIGIERELKV